LLSWAVVAGGNCHSPDVAYHPELNEYLIAYVCPDPMPPQPSQIRAKLAVASLFGVSTSSDFLVCCPPGDTEQTEVSLGSDPEGYLAVFQNGWPSGPIYGRRVNTEGVPLGPSGGFLIGLAGSIIPGGQAVASAPPLGYLAAWGGQVAPQDNLNGRFVRAGQDVAAGSEIELDNRSDTQAFPAVACAPNGNCLVVYHSNWYDPSDFDIHGVFVGPYRVFLPLVLRHGS
jgi:hypothetical protein